MAKKPSLLARLCAVPPVTRTRTLWIDNMPANEREELETVRAEFHAGHLKMYTMQQIFDFCDGDLKLPVKRSAFLRWLCEKPHG